jgi:SAM-dependent methyltransferase
MLVNFIQELHKSTPRDYMGRMNDNKVDCATIARRFDKNFFDGSRRFGYGGCKDDGRWVKIVQQLVDKYKIDRHSKVLDIGCGKGFLARDIAVLTSAEVLGCEISTYALENCAVPAFKFEAGQSELKTNFDLIISLNALHNLTLPDLKQAIQQIEAHSKQAYIVVESYRNVQELHNLQCWSLTAEQFLRPEEWEFLFKEWGYKSDYEFIFFE